MTIERPSTALLATKDTLCSAVLLVRHSGQIRQVASSRASPLAILCIVSRIRKRARTAGRCYRGACHSPWGRTRRGFLGEGALLAAWGAVSCWRGGAEPDLAGLSARWADRSGAAAARLGAAALCGAAEAFCTPTSRSDAATPRQRTCIRDIHTRSAGEDNTMAAHQQGG